MRQYWQNLNEREQLMVSVTAACLFFYLIYLLLYSPLETAVTNKLAELQEKKETLSWMQQVRQQPLSSKIPQPTSNAKILTLIDSQLNNGPLKPFHYQLQQTGGGDIELSFEQVPFAPFLLWLWNLTRDYAITLKQFSAERTGTPGMVKLIVTITTSNNPS
jgi:general secretion pathway protein M